MFGKSEVQKGGLGFVDKEEVWEEFKLDEPEKSKEKEKPKEMKHLKNVQSTRFNIFTTLKSGFPQKMLLARRRLRMFQIRTYG